MGGFDVLLRRLDPLIARARASAPRELAGLLVPLVGGLDARALEQAAIEEWNERMIFAGRRVRAGQVEAAARPMPLPGNMTFTAQVARLIAQPHPCGARICYLVRSYFASDRGTLRRHTGKPPAEVVQAINATLGRPRAGDVEVAGVAEVLLDPATMLPYGAAGVDLVRLDFRVPGQAPVPVVHYQTAEARVRYE